MAEIEDRILKLESELHRIYGGVSVAVVLLLGFFGFANFYQIPKAAKNAVPESVKNYLESEDPGLISRIKTVEAQAANSAASASSFANATKEFSEKAAKLLSVIQAATGPLYIDSGEVSLNSTQNPKIINPNGCEDNRGTINGNVVFKKAFSTPPQIAAGITEFDIESNANSRVSLTIDQVTNLGFSYTFKTWCDTKLYSATAKWIAIGQ